MQIVERSRALDSSSGVVRMWVRIPAWPVAALVSLSKTLNHNCFVLRMGRKAVGPVCCVMHVKEPRTLIVKEQGLARCFWIRALSTQQGGYVRATNLLYYYYYYYDMSNGIICRPFVNNSNNNKSYLFIFSAFHITSQSTCMKKVPKVGGLNNLSQLWVDSEIPWKQN